MTTYREWDGGKIREPGIYAGLPITEYHRDPCVGPSISSSGLRTIWSKSPAHYFCRSPYNPHRVTDDEPNEAFDIGRAAHHWLLGEPKFAESFVLSPYDDFRTKEAREWRDATRASGKTVLTVKQMDSIKGMRDGLMRHPLVHDGILDGEIERSLFWKDAETGIWLRSRPDVIPTADGVFVDLKTAADVSYQAISLAISAVPHNPKSHGYIIQAGLLRMGCKALGLPFEKFSFVFVEKSQPHCSRVVVLKDHELARGEDCARIALRKFAECLDTGIWPGPGDDSDDAEWVESPVWAQTATDERIAELKRTAPAVREAAE